MGQLDPLYRTDGFPRVPITDIRVEAADALVPNWLGMTKSSDFHRVKLAIGALLSGLKEGYGEERIHQYARALEGLILPDIGSSTRQFVHRCTTFTGMSEENRVVLRDGYNMCSSTEHLHPWDSALQEYSSGEREAVALRRTRQMERLAGSALRHLVGTPRLHEWFRNNEKINEFWHLPDHERAAIWGAEFNVSALA